MSTQWLYTPISCVSNVKRLILEEEKTVPKQWISKTSMGLKQNSWFALAVVTFLFKTAQNTEKISFSLNVSIVVVLHNGFVGETLIFATRVTKGNALETMYQSTPKTNFQNVVGQGLVLLEEITMEMVSKRC